MANENAGYFTRGLPTQDPGLLTGIETLGLDTQLTGGQSPQTAALTTTGLGLGFQTVAAAGASQGNATSISSSGAIVVVTVTASTEGIKLPSAAAGLVFKVLADPAVGHKVYPYTGDIIGAASANAAMAQAKNTVATFYAIDSTHWRVDRGA